jgi:anaerobic sulfite reductase subunit B
LRGTATGELGRAQVARGPMVPSSYRVVGKRQELADTWTLELEPDAGTEPVGEFAPGQFSMVYAFGSGEVPISLSRGVGSRRLMHTVRAAGEVTGAICAAEPGDALGIRGPFGNRWPLEQAVGGDLLVIAGGIGLAPLRPALDWVAAERGGFGATSLLYGARSPADLLYEADRGEWRRAGIEVEVTVDSAPAAWSGRVGLVTALIPGAAFDAERTTAMVCGPEVMMRFVASALLDLGVPAERIHVSLERNMKCAIGHCGHCQLAHRFVCRDGAIFPYSQVESLIRVREL